MVYFYLSGWSNSYVAMKVGACLKTEVWLGIFYGFLKTAQRLLLPYMSSPLPFLPLSLSP